MPQPKTSLNTDFVLNSKNAALLLDMSMDTLERYRSNSEIGWIQGIHWYQLPGGEYRYNRDLLIDWLANCHDPDAHSRAVQNFQDSLLSNRRKKRSA